MFDEGTELFRSTINPGGTCGTLPCWRAMNSGYKYIDRDRTPDGMLKTLLKAGATGKVPGRRAADGLPVQVAHITTGPLIDTVEVFKSTAEVPLP